MILDADLSPLMTDYWTEQQEQADRYAASRATEVYDFFLEFGRPDSDPSYLREREHELGITILEWTAYRESQAAKMAVAQGAF